MTADEMKGRVFMVCGDDETAKDVGDCLKRVASALSAVNSYVVPKPYQLADAVQSEEGEDVL